MQYRKLLVRSVVKVSTKFVVGTRPGRALYWRLKHKTLYTALEKSVHGKMYLLIDLSVRVNRRTAWYGCHSRLAYQQLSCHAVFLDDSKQRNGRVNHEITKNVLR